VVVVVLVSAWGMALTGAMEVRETQDTAELSEAAVMTADEPTYIDTSSLKAKLNPNDPFMPAKNLVKIEENATAKIPFTGPYRDIDAYVHKARHEISKEVFGGTNEMQMKAERIQQEKKDLKKTAASEMKALNISEADAKSPVGSLALTDEEIEARRKKASITRKADKKKMTAAETAAAAAAKRTAAAKEASQVVKSKRGTRDAAINKVKKTMADAKNKFAKMPCVDASCAPEKGKQGATESQLGEHRDLSKATGSQTREVPYRVLETEMRGYAAARDAAKRITTPAQLLDDEEDQEHLEDLEDLEDLEEDLEEW